MQARPVVVQTLIFCLEGTTNLELRVGRHIALQEVKSESPVREDQLRSYRGLLRDSGLPSTALILLTRQAVNVSELGERPDVHLRWYQVAEWLEQESTSYTFQPVSAYLVGQ